MCIGRIIDAVASLFLAMVTASCSSSEARPGYPDSGSRFGSGADRKRIVDSIAKRFTLCSKPADCNEKEECAEIVSVAGRIGVSVCVIPCDPGQCPPKTTCIDADHGPKPEESNGYCSRDSF